MPNARSLLTFLVLAAGCGGARFTSFADGNAADGQATTTEQPIDAGVSPLDAGTGVDSAIHEDGGLADAATDAARDVSADGNTPAPPHDASVESDALDEAVPDAAPDVSVAPSDAAEASDASDESDAFDTRDGRDETGGSDGDVAADAANEDACSAVVYFDDGDGDGYGGTTSWTGCAPPNSSGSGRWVTAGGDCDDSNADVHPKQAAYFATAYVPTGKSTPSFDYDCDGEESESGAAPKLHCQVVSLSCVGSGYVEASPVRSGPGVDPFCGSSEKETCGSSALSCTAGAPQPAAPIACR
jgi:hypothetical protein